MRGNESRNTRNILSLPGKSIGQNERRSNLAKVLPNRIVSTRKPKLGQHFLVDLDAMQRVVDALGDITGTTVVEIGPGEAALTELLAKHAGRLIAVELDRVLAAQLRMRFIPLTNVDGSTWQWSGEADEKLKVKLLLNDAVWQKGEDLVVAPGEKVQVAQTASAGGTP